MIKAFSCNDQAKDQSGGDFFSLSVYYRSIKYLNILKVFLLNLFSPSYQKDPQKQKFTAEVVNIIYLLL